MKAILFDLFGTLVDNPTEAQVQALHGEIARTLGVAPEEYRAGWKATFHDRSRGLHGGAKESIAAAAKLCSNPYDESCLDRALEIRNTFSREWLTPRPDATQTIAAFKEKGIVTGLLSNCTSEIPKIWETHEFASVIDHPLFSCTEGLRKPMPEFYLRALERMQVDANDCVYVADGDNGELAAAKKLGFSVVMIRPSWLVNDYRQEPEDDWEGERIERLGELLEIIIT